MANEGSEIQRQIEERLQSKRSAGGRRDIPGGNRVSRLLGRRIQFGASKREIATLARELALLQDLGVSLLRTLSILENRVQNPVLKKLIHEMRHSVESGQPLSEALSRYDDLFGDYFISAVRAGEESGQLSRTLYHLADYMDRQDGIQKRMRRVLTVPVLTLLTAAVVIMILFTYIIPIFAQVYEEAKVPLPQLTRVVLWMGMIIQNFWWAAVLVLVFIILLFFRSGKIIGMQRISDTLKLKLPVISGITERLITFRFARMTATMLNAGVSIMPALRLAGPATGNRIIAERMERACRHVDQGETISEALAPENVFSSLITDAISVGEEVGSVGTILEKLAEYSERDVEDLVSNFSIILEPIMTLIMGVVVLVIALALFLPYFAMNQVIL
ncbi:MAG TPA: type II secretion system F family protein [bacterium]|nr:type II secretion system F family protein [bacterium]